MDALKGSTARAHATTEEIPFNAGILDKSLPRERFAAQVRDWGSLHAAIESAIERQDQEAITRVWSLTGPRAGLLREDLTHLGDCYACSDAELVVQEFTQWVNGLADTDPIALLGVLYVFEGSQLGGMILKTPLSEMYDLDSERGLSYYSVHGPGIRKHWMAFREGMNASVVTEAQQASVIDAANCTFEFVGRLLECLSRDLSTSAA